MTCGLGNRRSIQLSYAGLFLQRYRGGWAGASWGGCPRRIRGMAAAAEVVATDQSAFLVRFGLFGGHSCQATQTCRPSFSLY